MELTTVVSHLSDTWSLADAGIATFAAGGAQGLPEPLAQRLERDLGDARVGLRERAFDASRAPSLIPWLIDALECGELASSLVQVATNVGRPSGPVPDSPDLPGQVAALAEVAGELAAVRVALDLARAAVALGGDDRMEESARQLITTARLQAETRPWPHPWMAQARYVTEQLLRRVGSMPEPVAEALAPAPLVLAVVQPGERVRDAAVTRSVAGLAPSAVLAARTAGRWTVPATSPTLEATAVSMSMPASEPASVPAQTTARPDRLVLALPSELVGPLRAASLDPDIRVSPQREERR